MFVFGKSGHSTVRLFARLPLTADNTLGKRAHHMPGRETAAPLLGSHNVSAREGDAAAVDMPV